MLSIALQHHFDAFHLDVTFDAPAGVTALYGRSGSGKSTIVSAVAGLLTPNAGKITVDGRVFFDHSRRFNVATHKRRLGYIFQDSRLFDHLSVSRNLDYGAHVSGRKVDPKMRAQIIEMLGLGSLLPRRPARLSGGEKQRVAIGRALLAQPRVILADEPLASLDGPRKAEILPYFEYMRDEIDIPIIYVSHSADEVARLATTVVALDGGKLVRCGPALDVLADPHAAPVGLSGVGAVLDVRVHAHHSDGLTELNCGGETLFLPQLQRAVGDQLRVRLPATDVMLATERPKGLSALNIVHGSISEIHQVAGASAIVAVATQAGPILARVTLRSVDKMGLAIGLPCYAIVKTVAIASNY